MAEIPGCRRHVQVVNKLLALAATRPGALHSHIEVVVPVTADSIEPDSHQVGNAAPAIHAAMLHAEEAIPHLDLAMSGRTGNHMGHHDVVFANCTANPGVAHAIDLAGNGDRIPGRIGGQIVIGGSTVGDPCGRLTCAAGKKAAYQERYQVCLCHSVTFCVWEQAELHIIGLDTGSIRRHPVFVKMGQCRKADDPWCGDRGRALIKQDGRNGRCMQEEG